MTTQRKVLKFSPKRIPAVRIPPPPTADTRQVGGTHYAEQAVQPWAAMEAWMTPEQFAGFLRGNAIKYLARADRKGGLDDIRKAQHYLEKLIEVQTRGGQA